MLLAPCQRSMSATSTQQQPAPAASQPETLNFGGSGEGSATITGVKTYPGTHNFSLDEPRGLGDKDTGGCQAAVRIKENPNDLQGLARLPATRALACHGQLLHVVQCQSLPKSNGTQPYCPFRQNTSRSVQNLHMCPPTCVCNSIAAANPVKYLLGSLVGCVQVHCT